MSVHCAHAAHGSLSLRWRRCSGRSPTSPHAGPARSSLSPSRSGSVAAFFGTSAARHLSSSDNDFQDPSSESFRTLQLLSSSAGVVPGPSVLVVGTPAQAAVAAARLRREPSIAVVQPRAAVSPDGRFVLVTASFHAGTGEHPAIAKRLAATLPGQVGGTAVANEEVRAQSEHDLFRAELIAFPLLFLLALWVFRGVVAAALPLLIGAALDRAHARSDPRGQRGAGRSPCSRSIS